MMEKGKLIYADSAKMVVEYIEQHLVACDSEFIQGYLAGVKEMANGLAKMPPVDAAPVVYGRWVYEEEPDENNNVQAHCSVCFAGDLHATALINKVPYCWKCGAKMDGGSDNE